MFNWSRVFVLPIIFCGICITFLSLRCDASAQTLERVKERGYLSCGVSQGLPGFSNPDSTGKWTGIDVDICRGISAAIFNDADKVRYIGLPAKDRFTALHSSQIDVLSHDTTWTMLRDVGLRVNFTGVNYYDGQGFMLRKSLNIKSVREMDGASFCTQTGTTTELNVADYFRLQGLKYEIVAFESTDETLKAYEAGRCDGYTNDVSSLYAQRLKMAQGDDHVILDEIISKEPLGPAVRHGDDQWFDIVKWTLFAMINAEELSVSSANADEALSSDNPQVRRFAGLETDHGSAMGLPRDWALRIIRLVGNYGEIYDKNVGSRSRLQIPRGFNRLWINGGIQYAPPVR